MTIHVNERWRVYAIETLDNFPLENELQCIDELRKKNYINITFCTLCVKDSYKHFWFEPANNKQASIDQYIITSAEELEKEGYQYLSHQRSRRGQSIPLIELPRRTGSRRVATINPQTPIVIAQALSPNTKQACQKIHPGLQTPSDYTVLRSPDGRIRGIHRNSPRKTALLPIETAETTALYIAPDISAEEHSALFLGSATYNIDRQTSYRKRKNPAFIAANKQLQLKNCVEKKQSQCITLATLIAAQKQPAERNQQAIMGGISAKDHANSHGYGLDKKIPNANWEWLHLVAYRLIGPEANFDPQTPENLVAGSSACNAHMMIFEAYIKYLILDLNVESVYLEVTAKLIEGTHIASQIIYEFTWETSYLQEKTSQTQRCVFNPLSFNLPIKGYLKMFKQLQFTKENVTNRGNKVRRKLFT